MRPNTPARSSVPNSNTPQVEDRSLHLVPDGWEKAKMKKKRTGIKADTSTSPNMSTKAINGYKEPKQGIHARHLSDSMSRLNDSHGLRYQFSYLQNQVIH